jgi:cytoskeletal protein CcmA (bactofilin family)
MFGSKKSGQTSSSSSLDNDQKIKNSKIDTLLGRGTTIDGDIRFSGGLHIEGMIKGNLTADDKDAMLVLSEHGHIQGEVNVPNIVVNGTIDGDVYANGKVELYEKARVCGDVYYNLLEMAVGSEVNGKLVRQKEDTRYASGADITEPEPS